MSQKAREEFEEAQRNQQMRNQARKIRTEVDRARENRTYAAKRWPFELLQNAHDTGPRLGRGQIEFSLRLGEDSLIVKHDGSFFTNRDLAALLSGGSNKEYDGEETTGRFGTGFLMTHAISTRPTVRGILKRQRGGYERFEIQLDRSGDEKAIEENIESAQEAIEAAEPIERQDIGSSRTAEFIYPLGEETREVVEQGVRRFQDALPYLFATCEDLGIVRLQVYDDEGIWLADEFRSYRSVPGTEARYREIEVQNTEANRLLRTVSVSPDQSSEVSAITVLEQGDDETWSVQEVSTGQEADPDQDASTSLPRVFVQFPIADTETLPLGCVLNGGFEPAKERDALKFESSKENLKAALGSIPPLLKLGSSQGWRGLHLLARMGQPEAGIGKGDEEDEIGWWTDQLQGVAEQLSSLKIVEAGEPASPSEVAFLYPRYSKDTDPAFSFESIYPLARRVQSLQMIREEIAREWSSIAEGWKALGISLERLGLRELARHVQQEADRIDELAIDGDVRRWLTDFISLLVEVDSSKSYSYVLDGIIPDQHGKLRRLGTLAPDDGVGNPLKEVASSLGTDIRGRLLDLSLQKLIQDSNERAFRVLKSETKDSLTMDRVIEECLTKLSHRLENDTHVSTDGEQEDRKQEAVEAGARLVHILRSRGEELQRVQRCPFLKADGKIDRISSDRPLMSPEETWPDSAQQFSEIYPESRVLNSWYADSEVGQSVVEDLSSTDLVYETPLTEESRSEVKEGALRHIATSGDISAKDRLRDEEFTLIAMLQPVLEKCKRDRGLAKALMGFVLNHAAVEDASWQKRKTVQVYRDREPRDVEVRKALWPAKLLAQAWIPMHQDGKEMTTVSARDAPIMDFVEPSWVRENPRAQEFLTDIFDIGSLEVALHSYDSEKERTEFENALAEITRKGPDTIKALAEEDPSLLAEATEEVREKRKTERQKEKNREFGLAVQDAVQVYLEDRGIDVDVIDCGYDFDLELPGDPTLEDGTHHLECGGQVKLEVKATKDSSASSVKLTPRQVRTARREGECFALCVVDLRNLAEEQIWDDWSAAEIEPHTRIIHGVGSELERSSRAIEELSQPSDTVSIGRSDKLRYRVHAPYWSTGQTISNWVGGILKDLATQGERG